MGPPYPPGPEALVLLPCPGKGPRDQDQGSRALADGVVRDSRIATGPSAAAIEHVPHGAGHHQNDHDHRAHRERHCSRSGQNEWPMKGSIRPPYSTTSHATMDETAMALSA